jgi:hypothetical protein
VKGIELYAGPPALGGPDDLDAVIRGFIDGAKQSMDTGTNSANNPTQPGNNLNHVLMLHGKAVSARYLEEFNPTALRHVRALNERVDPRPRSCGSPASGSNDVRTATRTRDGNHETDAQSRIPSAPMGGPSAPTSWRRIS